MVGDIDEGSVGGGWWFWIIIIWVLSIDSETEEMATLSYIRFW